MVMVRVGVKGSFKGKGKGRGRQDEVKGSDRVGGML
jgi:hypothetical protein